MNVFGRAELQRTVVGVVALLVTAGSTAAFAREFRAADTQNEAYPTVQALRFMGRQISERSGGRPEIKVFHSRQFGEEKETLEQTCAGAIDLNRTNVALTGNIVPAMFHSIEHMQNVMSLKAWETLSPDDRKIFRGYRLKRNAGSEIVRRFASTMLVRKMSPETPQREGNVVPRSCLSPKYFVLLAVLVASVSSVVPSA